MNGFMIYIMETETNVKWVVDKCNVCALNAPNKTKLIPMPIISNRCLNQLYIDLMDFRSKPDGPYKWIMQVKDHFSRYVWLYALKDKAAGSVAEKMDEWFGHNGYPKNLYVSLIFTF
jgi:hypothetical protein